MMVRQVQGSLYTGLTAVDSLRCDRARLTPADQMLPFLDVLIALACWFCTDLSRPVEILARHEEREGP